MRIVTRKQLMELPAGVVYQEYTPRVFGEMCIKGDTLESPSTFENTDWFMRPLLELGDSADWDEKATALEEGESIELEFECEGRDGCFADEQLYAVWEQKELIKAAELLLRGAVVISK